MEENRETLASFDFAALCLASTFAFCNIAIFYSLQGYLKAIGIDPAWQGIIIAAEPSSALILRPWLSFVLTPAKALACIRIGLAGNGLALLCYQFAHSIPALLAVRLFHGSCFVLLVSAVTVLLAGLVPRGQSARAFGIFSLTSLVPFALMPPLVESLLPRFGGEPGAYAAASVLVLPALAVLIPYGRARRARQGQAPHPVRPALKTALGVIRQAGLWRVLAANACVFTCSTLFFFFAKGFGRSLGMQSPGVIFTVSTAATILARTAGSGVFDKLPKGGTLFASSLVLGLCLIGVSRATGQESLLVLTGVYGLCLGVAMPLLNALMFERSPADLRGTNLNLMLFMMDLGYVLGPLAGGAIVELGLGYAGLFMTAGAAALAAGALILPLAKDKAGER